MSQMNPIKTHETLLIGLRRHLKILEFELARSEDPIRRKHITREMSNTRKNMMLHQEQIARLQKAQGVTDGSPSI